MTRNHEAICEALRSAVMSVYGTPVASCVAAANAIQSVYADAEIWSCQVDGQPHYLAKLDGWYIDATCDQFGHYYAELVFADRHIGDCDIPHYAFRRDTTGQRWDRQAEINAAFRAALEERNA